MIRVEVGVTGPLKTSGCGEGDHCGDRKGRASGMDLRHPSKKVLPEDDYINALSSIIERDYFPHAQLVSDKIDQPPYAGLSLDDFLSSHTSEDNANFEALQLKDSAARRRARGWMFKPGEAEIYEAQAHWLDPQLYLTSSDSASSSSEVVNPSSSCKRQRIGSSGGSRRLGSSLPAPPMPSRLLLGTLAPHAVEPDRKIRTKNKTRLSVAGAALAARHGNTESSSLSTLLKVSYSAGRKRRKRPPECSHD